MRSCRESCSLDQLADFASCNTQVEASPSVVKACETIVRAHEACVATLNTEYQVSSTHFSLHLLIPKC
jgi:hypothetical protein